MADKQLWEPKYRTGDFPTVVDRGLAAKLGTNDGEFALATDINGLFGIVQLAALRDGGRGTLYEEGGDAHVQAGGAFDRGDNLTVNSSGKFVKIGTTAGTYHCAGIARDDASADGDIVRMKYSKFSVTIS